MRLYRYSRKVLAGILKRDSLERMDMSVSHANMMITLKNIAPTDKISKA